MAIINVILIFQMFHCYDIYVLDKKVTMTLRILLFENAGKPFNVLINLSAMGTAKTQIQQCNEW